MNKAITTVLVTGATIAGVAGVLVLNPAMPSPGSATHSDESPALAEQDQSIRNPSATQVLGDGDFDGDEDDDSGEDDGDQESGRSISDPSTSAPSPQSTISGSQSPSQLSTTAGATSYTGSSYQSPWGAMQVSISVSDGQITDIQWEQIPQGDGHSYRINSYAAPLLVDQALQAQSASVDGVSGATYTTEGFRTSLQSAIQKAGL